MISTAGARSSRTASVGTRTRFQSRRRPLAAMGRMELEWALMVVDAAMSDLVGQDVGSG
jgi:hypothetical protein